MTVDPLWPGAWRAETGGVEVLVGDVDAAAALPHPNAADLADAGRRTGEALRLFLRRRGLLRVLAARRLAAEPAAVVVGYDARGAPVLRTALPPPAPRLFLSVSARGRIAGFALAASPVGLDIEVPASFGPIDAALAPAERAALAAAPDADRPRLTLACWAAKEAYLKALGTGLMHDPARVEIVAGPAAGGFAVRDGGRDAPGTGRWLAPAAGGEGLVAALFCRGA